MATDRSPLIIIPVRGGSVGLPKKALRLLGGKPVLLHTIETARTVGSVVVTTDDEFIATLSKGAGAGVHREPPSDGKRPLDPIIYDAAKDVPHPIVVTVQATSPFLTAETIQRCIGYLSDGYDTALTVRDDRGLRWGGSLDAHKARPPARVIRQDMTPMWRETGGCLATKREHLTPLSRFGPKVRLVEVSGAEAVDLDTPEDWAVAEMYAGMTTRELLLARVLGEASPHRGLVVQFSAWGESEDEVIERQARAALIGGDVVTPVGAHTYAEAETALAMLRDGTALTLVTSAYHQLRVFLTALKVLQRAGRDRQVRLWNAAAPSSMDKLHTEWQKIVRYQADGYVASYDDGLRYLDWRDG